MELQQQRPLQIGDISTITGNGIRRKYTVVGFDENSIIIADSNDVLHLIGSGDNWYVQGWNTLHHIVFGHSGLTDVMDVNRKILLDMYYGDILNVCMADVIIREMCNDELFWAMKVQRDFGRLEYIKELITAGMKYKDLYKRLMMSPENVIVAGRLDILERMNFPITVLLMYQSIVYGHLDILKWLLEKHIGHNRPFKKLSYNEGAIQAVFEFIAIEFGQIHILEWLVEQGLTLDSVLADKAAEYGQIAILDWLAAKSIVPDTSDQALFEQIIGNGKIASLEWLKQHGVQYDSDIADIAVREDQLPVLKWLAERNVYPSQKGFWLTISVSPYSYGVTDIFNEEILEWILDMNIKHHIFNSIFIQNAVDWIAGEGLIDVLQFFANRGILPTMEGANNAKEYDRKEVLDWLASQGIYPSA